MSPTMTRGEAAARARVQFVKNCKDHVTEVAARDACAPANAAATAARLRKSMIYTPSGVVVEKGKFLKRVMEKSKRAITATVDRRGDSAAKCRHLEAHEIFSIGDSTTAVNVQERARKFKVDPKTGIA